MAWTRLLFCILGVILMSPVGHAQWQSHTVQQLDLAKGPTAELPAQRQIVNQSWNRPAEQTYLVYMPEKDRLIMAVNSGGATLIFSDDRGARWTDPRPPQIAAAGSSDMGSVRTLNYLGQGKCILGTGSTRWFSYDYGETWRDPEPIAPAPNGGPWHQWDPYLVEVDPQTGEVVRLAETAWNRGGGTLQAFIRFSYDEGKTWTNGIAVPQWRGSGEVALVKAANGDIIAGCRLNPPAWYQGSDDYYCGLGVSRSEDDGKSWSQVAMLYTFGRHHPSMVVMGNGDIVMTYVVRLGYPGDAEGFPQRGIEAVVSHDNGITWEVCRPFVVDKWSGSVFQDAPQSTSSVRLPDDSILTAYGAGYPCNQPDGKPYPGGAGPHAIGLVRWRLPETSTEDSSD